MKPILVNTARRKAFDICTSILVCSTFLYACSSNSEQHSESMITQTPSAEKVADLAGDYEISYGPENFFSCTLHQQQDSIHGSYCGHSPLRVDCGVASQGAPNCPISGVVIGDTAYLNFVGCHTGKPGKAKVFKTGEDLNWITTSYPERTDSEIYFCAAPNNEVLKNTAFPDPIDESDEKFEIELAQLGINDEYSFPDHYESLNWHSLLNKDGGFVFAPFPINIAEEQVEDELNGPYQMKNLQYDSAASGSGFILSSDELIDDEWHALGTFDFEAHIPNQEQRIIFPNSDWYFYATADEEDHGPVNYRLYLRGTKNGELLEQEIVHHDFLDDAITRFLWVGDLDGDQLPDFLLDIAHKYTYSDKVLFLSSKAGEDTLVEKNGQILGSPIGC